MLARKLDTATLKLVRQRADFFFSEQLKRLGPLPELRCDAAISSPPILVTPAARKRGRPRTKP